MERRIKSMGVGSFGQFAVEAAIDPSTSGREEKWAGSGNRK